MILLMLMTLNTCVVTWYPDLKLNWLFTELDNICINLWLCVLTICLQIAEKDTACSSHTSYGGGCKSSQLPGLLCLWQYLFSNFRLTSLISHIVPTIICLNRDSSQRRPSRALSTSYHLGLAALMHNVLPCSFFIIYCHSLILSCHFWDSLMGAPKPLTFYCIANISGCMSSSRNIITTVTKHFQLADPDQQVTCNNHKNDFTHIGQDCGKHWWDGRVGHLWSSL